MVRENLDLVQSPDFELAVAAAKTEQPTAVLQFYEIRKFAMKIQIFDRPMCCSTGICGPGVDPVLVSFSADLDWLKRQGVDVERYNLSQQTEVFVGNSIVNEALKKHGNQCLPLTLLDGNIVAQGAYLTREQLAVLAGIEAPKKGLKVTVE